MKIRSTKDLEEFEDMEREIVSLRYRSLVALRKYGQHLSTCCYWYGSNANDCTCGFSLSLQNFNSQSKEWEMKDTEEKQEQCSTCVCSEINARSYTVHENAPTKTCCICGCIVEPIEAYQFANDFKTLLCRKCWENKCLQQKEHSNV